MTENKVSLLPCPFCGSDQHLGTQRVGVLTGDMPARPYRIVCHHIDHDTVAGPTAYGEQAAITAWNTRHSSEEVRLREALEKIAKADRTTLMCDPLGSQRIARTALSGYTLMEGMGE